MRQRSNRNARPGVSLKIRVFALVCVMVVTFVVALALLSLEDLVGLLHDNFQARGELAVNYFARTSVEGIIIEDEVSLAETISRLFEIEDVVYAGIYDSERTLIMQQATTETPDMAVLDVNPDDETVVREEVLVGKDGDIRVLDFTVAVFDAEGERIGWVRTGISLQEIDGEIWNHRLQSLGLVGGFVVVALTLTFLLAGSIANPINALVTKAEYIAYSRDYSMRAENSETMRSVCSSTVSTKCSNR